MKKVISSLLVAAMAICGSTAKADNVSATEASEVAASFMRYYTGVDKLSAADMTLVYQIDNEKLGVPAAYFFNMGGDGWVIMAGSNVTHPIIGYSTTGSLDIDKLPENMMWFTNAYAEKIAEMQALDAEYDVEEHPMWTSLKNGSYKGDTKESQIVLMSEVWGQGDEYNPSFNMFCPQDTNGRYAVVGCVATAMSQIIHYYRYPRKPQGHPFYFLRQRTDDAAMPNISLEVDFDTVVFDYDLMPNVPANMYGTPTCSSAEMREVAELSYYAGLTVKMAYSPDGSGTQSAFVPSAMRQNFKYTAGQLIYRGEYSATNRTFVNRMRASLMERNVLYMGGASSTNGGRDASGHAWVCGGYMAVDTNQFYMNWGWSGSGNGFFNLGKNRMKISGTNYNFNVGLEFIDGMVPPADSNRVVTGINDIDDTQLGNPYPNPATSKVMLPYKTQQAADLMVYNMEGKPVATYRVMPGSGEVAVDVVAMPAGLYVYRLNNQHGKFIVK